MNLIPMEPNETAEMSGVLPSTSIWNTEKLQSSLHKHKQTIFQTKMPKAEFIGIDETIKKLE